MRYWWVNQNQTYRHELQGGQGPEHAHRGGGLLHSSQQVVQPLGRSGGQMRPGLAPQSGPSDVDKCPIVSQQISIRRAER